MTALIPVICKSYNCGAIWFSNSIFGIGPGATIYSIGTMTGPCPKCGGAAYIPDGVYTHTSASLFNVEECNLVLNALKILLDKTLQGASTEEIKEEIKRNFSFLAAFEQFLPKNAGELAAYIAILVTLFMNYEQSKQHEPSQSVHIQVNISQALEQVSSCLKNNQQSTQDQHTEPEVKQKQK